MTGTCLSVTNTTDVLPCHIQLPVYLLIMDPQSRTSTKNTSYGDEVLPQDATHLIQRPCCQRGSLCQVPAGNRNTRRPPDSRKETQTHVVWTSLPFIRSDQTLPARHSERRKKTRQTDNNNKKHTKKRWEDIWEWTGLEFAKSLRAVENREKGKKLVVKSYVVPQRPPWLRDR